MRPSTRNDPSASTRPTSWVWMKAQDHRLARSAMFSPPREPGGDPSSSPLLPPGDYPQSGLYLGGAPGTENGTGFFPENML